MGIPMTTRSPRLELAAPPQFTCCLREETTCRLVVVHASSRRIHDFTGRARGAELMIGIVGSNGHKLPSRYDASVAM
jgi:hypothetical protein